METFVQTDEEYFAQKQKEAQQKFMGRLCVFTTFSIAAAAIGKRIIDDYNGSDFTNHIFPIISMVGFFGYALYHWIKLEMK